MRSEHKLIVRATVTKHIKEEYVLDCTGMTMDEVKSAMEEAYIEDLPKWEWVNTETDHSEIDMELEIQ
jgi:hypothetical protein